MGPGGSLVSRIEIDTMEGVLRLPQAKLRCLQRLLCHHKACQRRQLELLVRVMQHAATVVRPGRTFLRCAIDLLRELRKKHHFITLHRQFRVDVNWWLIFATQWNGVAVLLPSASECFEFASDASGAWGCNQQPKHCTLLGSSHLRRGIIILYFYYIRTDTPSR